MPLRECVVQLALHLGVTGQLMPAAFTRAIAQGARVRTIKIGKNKYMHVAFLHGKSYAGEVKVKKGK